MILFGYEITIKKHRPKKRKLSTVDYTVIRNAGSKKYGNTLQRKMARNEFFREHESQLETLFSMVTYENKVHKGYMSQAGQEIVLLAKEKLGYSKTTAACDIFTSIRGGFISWKESGI